MRVSAFNRDGGHMCEPNVPAKIRADSLRSHLTADGDQPSDLGVYEQLDDWKLIADDEVARMSKLQASIPPLASPPRRKRRLFGTKLAPTTIPAGFDPDEYLDGYSKVDEAIIFHNSFGRGVDVNDTTLDVALLSSSPLSRSGTAGAERAIVHQQVRNLFHAAPPKFVTVTNTGGVGVDLKVLGGTPAKGFVGVSKDGRVCSFTVGQIDSWSISGHNPDFDDDD